MYLFVVFSCKRWGTWTWNTIWMITGNRSIIRLGKWLVLRYFKYRFEISSCSSIYQLRLFHFEKVSQSRWIQICRVILSIDNVFPHGRIFKSWNLNLRASYIGVFLHYTIKCKLLLFLIKNLCQSFLYQTWLCKLHLHSINLSYRRLIHFYEMVNIFLIWRGFPYRIMEL